MSFKKLWTIEEFARYLNVPKTWIYERTRKNGPEWVPHLKLGKYIRFDPESEELKSWIKAHEVALLGEAPNGHRK